MKRKLRLPKKSNIWVTGKTDPVHRHYHPIVSYFMNKRLTGALDLLGDGKCGRLLDVGFGGGVFLPELAQLSEDLYGVDIHDNIDKVSQMLTKENVKAKLSYGDVTNLPFEDSYFDKVVCISVLEFVKDLDKAFSELSRVTKKDGEVIIGFPVVNVLTDIAFWMICINSRKAHPVTHKNILASAQKFFKVDAVKRFPLNLPITLSLFAHCRLKKAV